MLVAACFVVTALLLWLAAGVAVAADRRGKALATSIRLGAAALVVAARLTSAARGLDQATEVSDPHE